VRRPIVVVELLFLALFWSWVCSAVLFLRNTVLPRLPLTATPELLKLSSNTVRFRSTDGVALEGWKIPGDASRPWLILCHGAGSNRSDLLDIAQGLHDEGFNLFLFDFRGHGGSEGRVTSFGWREQRDLEGALAFLGQQPDVPDRPYGIYGISMGGAVALMVAARDERLGAVAVDSPYTNLADTLGRHLTLMYPVPKIPFHWFILATYRLRFGIWPSRVSPQEACRTLSPRALLLIHGGQDPRMPVEGARAMYAAAKDPKDLWVIEGAGHLEGYAVDPQTYRRRLAHFFHSRLGL
jgi:alpha-beta hydrolase superfamily lysophospholipase